MKKRKLLTVLALAATLTTAAGAIAVQPTQVHATSSKMSKYGSSPSSFQSPGAVNGTA